MANPSFPLLRRMLFTNRLQVFSGRHKPQLRSKANICYRARDGSFPMLSSSWLFFGPFLGNADNVRLCKHCGLQRAFLSATKSTDEATGSGKREPETKRVDGAASTTEGEIVTKEPEVKDTKATINLRETMVKMAPKKPREKFDVNQKSTDRNFITTIRAMGEYLLKPSDLEDLRKIYRRSPYDSKPPIAVYLRKDVELRAIEVWGSKEALEREQRKREEQNRKHRESVFEVKKIIKEFKAQYSAGTEESLQNDSLWKGSGRVVLIAVIINASNFTLKVLAWVYTGSHSMFSEAIHSLADTLNQLILAYGIHKSIQKADSYHPYGYTNMRYVASLISGVGIFFMGTGLSFYHGIMALIHSEPVGQLYWAFYVLGGSLVSEGATLIVAIEAIRKGAKAVNMTFTEYVMRSEDPSVNVVLLEDIAAVTGVGIASVCMGLSFYLNNPIPDAVGSFLIAGLLGIVASFIIKTNIAALTGRSVPVQTLSSINRQLENDVMIRAIHDAKCIDMGSSLVRYKAEIDFDGRELTRSYLDKQDLDALLEHMQSMKSIEELESFMLHHGENVIDLVGAEIDRIESQLKKEHPEIRHCDLEML